MHLQKRTINGKTYMYIDHSFRIGNKIKKVSLMLDKEKEKYNEEIIERIAKERAAYFKDHFQTYFSLQEIIEIETEKVFYQIFFHALDQKSKQEILAEFTRLFLANSMELEGSTITPQIAEDIERKKKNTLPELDVKLYDNSKRVLFKVIKHELRSVIQFKHLHKELYDRIYPHAGDFKKQANTFGYTEKAATVLPNEIREKLKKILEEYRDKKIYSFLKPLLFHLQYQKAHPFAD
ncbi:MAG: Fic family protein, partial [Nanoarchaeota archaeon]